jgi:hypothetical protein
LKQRTVNVKLGCARAPAANMLFGCARSRYSFWEI